MKLFSGLVTQAAKPTQYSLLREPRHLIPSPKQPTGIPEELSNSPAPPDANRWGVLVEEEIKSQKLIQVPDPEHEDDRCYKHASYDLRLGREYMNPHEAGKNGQLEISRCDENGMITIKRFASVIVSTYESVVMPDNVVGRFDLRIRHALEGLIAQMGTQVEPGYKGQLVALVHNISQHDVSLKVRDYETRPFTIEFCYTSQRSIPPENKKTALAHFIPPNVATGGIDLVLHDIEEVQKNVNAMSQDLNARKMLYFTGAALLLIVATATMFIPWTLAKFTYDKDYFPIVNTQAIAAMKNGEVVEKILRELETRSSSERLYVERLALLKARRDSLKGDRSRAQELKAIEKEIDQIVELLKK